MEDQSCWAEEGAGVNYSITGWLSQELFKQAPVSRGLGLITPAKVTPTTLPHCFLLRACQPFWGIFIWRRGRDIGREKRLRSCRGETGEGKKSKLARTMELNSNGSSASSPELSQGYNYPPKCPSVARLASEAQVTLPPHQTEPMAIAGHRLCTVLLLAGV